MVDGLDMTFKQRSRVFIHFGTNRFLI